MCANGPTTGTQNVEIFLPDAECVTSEKLWGLGTTPLVARRLISFLQLWRPSLLQMKLGIPYTLVKSVEFYYIRLGFEVQVTLP